MKRLFLIPLILLLTISLSFGAISTFTSSKVYMCNAYTGGATGALDSIDGAALNDGDIAFVVYSYDTDSELTCTWHYLDSDSGASESGIRVVSPDSNAGDKRWIWMPPFAVDDTEPTLPDEQIWIDTSS